MRVFHPLFLAMMAVALNVIGRQGNGESLHSPVQPPHNWELVRTVPDPSGDPIDFVLVSGGKIADLANYQAAGDAIAGARTNCLMYFWAERSQIPTSAWVSITNLEAMTATYERRPIYCVPDVHLASWLYPNAQAAIHGKAIFLPGVANPKSGPITNQAPDLIRAVSAISRALPSGWALVKEKFNEIPDGHHWGEDYAGPTGLYVLAKGIRPISADFPDRKGESHLIPISTESLEIWLMPRNYHDSFWSRFSVTCPIQPWKVVGEGPLKIYASPGAVLNSERDFWEILSKYGSVDWPDPQWYDPGYLSWEGWRNDLRKAVEKEFAK